MDKNRAGLSRRNLGLGVIAATLGLQGCVTTGSSTQVKRDTDLQADEGVVTLRVVNLGSFQVHRIHVKSEGSGQVYELEGVHFGQTSSATFVGRLPAGRYHPHEMFAAGRFASRTSPLASLTGKFDVEARRVTDLGTIIHASRDPVSEAAFDVLSRDARKTDSAFVLLLEPTSVPSEKLLATRFPAAAAAVRGRTVAGWVPGTVPAQAPSDLAIARTLADEASPPALPSAGRVLTGGRMGVVVERTAAGRKVHSTGSIHQIESVLVLEDGRVLAGGEEGYVAVSDRAGQGWKALPRVAPDEVVIHLAQAPGGALYLVGMGESGTTVYTSPLDAIAWTAVRILPSARNIEHSFLAGARERDSAVSTRDRLVVHTMPDVVSTLDFRSGQWETQKTPRSFAYGMRATADGYVIGKNAPAYVYGTLDYGRTWTRLEGWTISSDPVFTDRQRGLIISAGMGYSPSYRLRRTEDGGRTWSEGTPAGRLMADSLWLDADGKTLYAMSLGRFYTSRDGGLSWH